MAVLDIHLDYQPQNVLKPYKAPKVSSLRTALIGVNGGLTYTMDRLNDMTENDMLYAARVHGLAIGTPTR
jgi:hypothetical protein